MIAAFAYSALGLAVVALLVVVAGVLRGRTAKHEDGDRVAAEALGIDPDERDGGDA